MRTLERLMAEVPEDCFVQHCSRNDFSRWLFARTEITLASKLRPHSQRRFSERRKATAQYLISLIGSRRSRRQKGVVANFEAGAFDLDTEFFKIGKGSLGGKARGLAFMGNLLQRVRDIHRKLRDRPAVHPPDARGHHRRPSTPSSRKTTSSASPPSEAADEEVAEAFRSATFPQPIADDLRAYLARITYPLAVRSSSLLEDAKFRAYAGLYRTCMLPNDHPSLDVRLRQLIEAIKLVYASTYFQKPQGLLAAGRPPQRRGENGRDHPEARRPSPAAGISTRRSPGWPSPTTTTPSAR